MSSDYVTGGLPLSDLLTLFYVVPLAPIYLDKPNLVIRPDGRVHGVFPDAGVTFIITPEDVTPWQEAYDANVALFR